MLLSIIFAKNLSMRKSNRIPQVFNNVEIIDVGSEGKAIAKIDNQVIFVPFVVPGDVVDIQITKSKKSFKEGKAIKIHQYSKLRIDAKCSHFGVCGGCKWQNMSYNQQLFFKQKQVKDSLQRIAKVEIPEIMDILPSEDQYYYRNKLEYTFSNRKWLVHFNKNEDNSGINFNGVGFHIPGMFDKIVDIDHCYLQLEPSNKIRLSIKNYAFENNLSFYNVRRWEGFLRNLLIRTSSTGDLMVIMVVNDKEKEKIEGLMNHLKSNFPEITSMFYVVNQKKNDDISDQVFVLFHGKPYILERMPTVNDPQKFLTFKIGPISFYQTNSKQAYNLYKIAADFADFKGHEIVYDLYTGTGTIANFVAYAVKKVIGLEYIPSAIEDAIENSKINGIENTLFYAGAIEKIMDNEFIQKNGKPDIIITDPPRAGMHAKVIDKLLKMSPDKIIYISCNPATQARDIALLNELYFVEKIQPIDMFPQTHHVENVILLKKKV